MSQADPPRTTTTSPSSTAAGAASPSADAPTPLGRSAKRLFGWATNLLAIAVVLAAGLAFGRQVLVWWRGEPEPPAAPLAGSAQPGQSAGAHRLEFGDVPLVFEHEAFLGPRSAVLERLVKGCQAIAAARPRVSQTAGPAELRMLERTANQIPVVETDGFRVYQLERPLPMAAAVAQTPTEDGSSPRDRVVSWGLAMPVGEAQQVGSSHQQADDAEPSSNELNWTLFNWSAGSGLRAAAVNLPPLPPGARRTMLLASKDGAAVAAFRLEGSPGDAMRHFSEHFENAPPGEDWAAASPWRETNNVWHAGFYAAQSGTVDVQLTIDGDGILSGVLTASPPAPTSEE
ncbi:MAG: hypothetical protein RIC55_32435 [Pirellulaceae bacterium]